MDCNFNIASLPQKIKITTFYQICEAIHKTQNIKLKRRTETKLHKTILYRRNFHAKKRHKIKSTNHRNKIV